MAELSRQQAVSDVFAQKLTVKITKVKPKLVRVATKRLELSTKLGTVEVESYKKLDTMTVMRDTRDYVERLARSIVGQSAESPDEFVNQVGT